jgi:hypothetical protein
MSNRTGDKSRHHRQRKEKIRRREKSAALMQGASAKPKAAKATKPAAK